jgi:hypothetical protein
MKRFLLSAGRVLVLRPLARLLAFLLALLLFAALVVLFIPALLLLKAQDNEFDDSPIDQLILYGSEAIDWFLVPLVKV